MRPDRLDEDRARLGTRVEHADRCSIVSLDGELDISGVTKLRAVLTEVLIEACSPARIVVDLTDLSFMDSSGLGLLVHAQKKARVLRTQFEIVCPEGTVRRLLVVTGMIHVLSVYESLDAAMAGAQS